MKPATTCEKISVRFDTCNFISCIINRIPGHRTRCSQGVAKIAYWRKDVRRALGWRNQVVGKSCTFKNSHKPIEKSPDSVASFEYTTPKNCVALHLYWPASDVLTCSNRRISLSKSVAWLGMSDPFFCQRRTARGNPDAAQSNSTRSPSLTVRLRGSTLKVACSIEPWSKTGKKKPEIRNTEVEKCGWNCFNNYRISAYIVGQVDASCFTLEYSWQFFARFLYGANRASKSRKTHAQNGLGEFCILSAYVYFSL